jgi:hypothetical protein
LAKFKHQETETFMKKHYKSHKAQTPVDPNPSTPLCYEQPRGQVFQKQVCQRRGWKVGA